MTIETSPSELLWNSIAFIVVEDDDERLVDVPDGSVRMIKGKCYVGRTLWARLEPELKQLQRH